jgi:hypothetical protein
MTHKLAKYFGISPFSFDNVDYFEFLEQFDLMEEYYKMEESNNKQGNSLSSLLNGN